MPYKHIVATHDGNKELRAAGFPNAPGFGGPAWIDPSAIPPPGLWSNQRAGVNVTPHSLLLVDVIFTALRVISNTVIKMGDLWPFTESFSDDNIPYRKYQRDRYAILTDTFGGGNTGGVGGSMMQCTGRDRTIWSMALFGECFWYVLDRETKAKKAGLPSAVEVLHPAFMEVTADDHDGHTVFEYGAGQSKVELDPENVIVIPFKSLPQARRALSPVTYSSVAGALAMAAYEFGSTWFSQGASPSFLLSTDQKLGQAEVQRIASKFQIDHAGLSNAHVPVVVDSGLKVDKISATPDEAQYLHTLEYARNVIASWFGLPASLLGNALERQTPQPAHTLEEETSRFLQFTLSGYMVPLEEAHSGLLPDGVKAAFNESALSRPDAQFLAQLIMALRQSQIASIDELRTRYMGLGPDPSGAGASIINPLASNTDQSAMPSGGTGDKPAKPAIDDESQRALQWLVAAVKEHEQRALPVAT